VCFQEIWAACRGVLSSATLTLLLDAACKVVGLQSVPDLLLAFNALGPGHRAGWASSCFVVQTWSLFCLRMTFTAHRMVGLSGVEYGVAGTGLPLSTLTRRLQPHAVGSCLLFPAKLAIVIPSPRFSCPWYNHTRLGVWSSWGATLSPLPPLHYIAFIPWTGMCSQSCKLTSAVHVRITKKSCPYISIKPKFIAPCSHLGLSAILTAVQRRRLPCNSSLLSLIKTAGHPVVYAFWHAHRRAWGYAHSGQNSSARLDWVLLSDDLIPFLHRCWVEAGSCTTQTTALAVLIATSGCASKRWRCTCPFWTRSWWRIGQLPRLASGKRFVSWLEH
jgi:hypothetical protein